MTPHLLCCIIFEGTQTEIEIVILRHKPTGRRLLGRPRHKYEGSIKIYSKETSDNTRNYIDSAQDRSYWRELRMRT